MGKLSNELNTSRNSDLLPKVDHHTIQVSAEFQRKKGSPALLGRGLRSKGAFLVYNVE